MLDNSGNDARVLLNNKMDTNMQENSRTPTDSQSGLLEHDKVLLSRLQLFRNCDLDSSDMAHLLSLCNYRTLQEGELLLSKETENEKLYVLIKGRLVITLTDREDSLLTIVEPGECVGEMSIIERRAPSADVHAAELATVLEIGQETLWRMVSASHEISRNLLYIMSERLRYSNLVIADSFEMQRKFQRYAYTDSLTGLHNRGWLDDMFAREVSRTERESLPLCLIMIDVDHFKGFNDTYGHLAGDQALIKVGESIRQPLRPNDLVARFGGEEFSVLLPETKIEHAKIIAERLRERVYQTELGIIDGQLLPKVSISLGVTEYRPNHTLEELIAAADVAMYQAKQNGRNRVQIARPS